MADRRGGSRAAYKASGRLLAISHIQDRRKSTSSCGNKMKLCVLLVFATLLAFISGNDLFPPS